MKRALLFAVLLAACSSKVETPADTSDAGPSREQACNDFVDAFCATYDKCLPLFVDVGFGDLATCKSRMVGTCPAAFDAPKTSSTPAHIDACATALKGLSACERLSLAEPSACVPNPGGLENDQPCADDAQCKSTFCAKADEKSCGKCTQLSTDKSACVDLGPKADGSADKKCSRGFACGSAGCVHPGVTGDSCSDAAPCALGLACFSNKCVPAGRAGAKCDPMGKTDPPCDFLQGVYCQPTDKVCRAFGYAKAGEACGLVGTDYKICVAGAHCTASGLMMGTCMAAAADGAACDAKNGPTCLAPAICESGKCTMPDPQRCK